MSDCFIIRKTFSFESNVDKFAKIILNNFKNTKDNKNLNHDFKNIKRMLKSHKFLGLFVYNKEGQIVGYLLGEMETIPDGRLVFFILYIFVSKSNRQKKVGTHLLFELKKVIKNEIGLKFIMVLCNNAKEGVCNFYSRNGFIKDPMFNDNCKIDSQVYCELMKSTSMYESFFEKNSNYKLLTYYI